jgi:ankyrin repeat protein
MYIPLMTIVALCAAHPPQRDSAYETALATALHRFAGNGELRHVKAILERHPKLINSWRERNSKPDHDEDFTLLHRAAASGNAELAEYLIGKGADVNGTAGGDNGGGWTPLHWAARKGHLAVVKRLVEKGARLDARTGSPSVISKEPSRYAGRTALELAALEKHPDVVAYLRAAMK